MAKFKASPTPGDGNLYSYLEPECYNALMNVLRDPSNEWYEFLQDESGMSITEIQAALGGLVYEPTYDVYYDPDNENSKWDLMGDYGDLCMAIEGFGDMEGVDCGLGVITILNSHQGVGGL